MKKICNFLPLFMLTCSVIHAQSSKDSLPAKSFEQKEIKATNHLKKELEQKQLSAPPERIADTSFLIKKEDKRKKKKCKTGTVNESNKQSD